MRSQGKAIQVSFGNKLGGFQNSGYLITSPHNEDYKGILGSISGSPILGNYQIQVVIADDFYKKGTMLCYNPELPEPPDHPLKLGILRHPATVRELLLAQCWCL